MSHGSLEAISERARTHSLPLLVQKGQTNTAYCSASSLDSMSWHCAAIYRDIVFAGALYEPQARSHAKASQRVSSLRVTRPLFNQVESNVAISWSGDDQKLRAKIVMRMRSLTLYLFYFLFHLSFTLFSTPTRIAINPFFDTNL